MTAPSAPPACVADQGSWCATVYGWTHHDLLARSADQILDVGISVLVIVLLAVLARTLLHRAIGKLVRGAADGRVRIPSRVRSRLPGRLRGPASGLRDLAGPLLSERRAQRANTIGSVLRSITSAVVLVVALGMLMAEFGFDLAPILASAGIVGVAVGFGAQNLVRDFLSGIFMMLEDQYGVGDIVDLGEAGGTVEAVGLRITTLRDHQGTVWHVRNGEIRRVGNKTQGYAIAVVDLPLAHQADPTRAAVLAGQVATQVAEDAELVDDVLEAPTVLGVDKVTVEGMTLRLTVKVNPGRQFAVQRALNAALVEAFDRAGVPLASPGPVPGPAAGAPSGKETR